MSTNTQIEQYVSQHAPDVNFLGCFWNNTLPTTVPENSNIIANYSANTDDTNGTHWIAMINLNPTNGQDTYYFDSFGEKPDQNNSILDTHAHFKNYMTSHSRSYICNKDELQGVTSSVCGHYCCLAVVSQSIPIPNKNHGTVWRKLCSKHTTPEENDELIRQMIKL